MNQQEPKTPRTDAEIRHFEYMTALGDIIQVEYVKSSFARTLELELAEARRREQELIAECVDYRGYLYGCDKHRLWKGMSCIGCLEQERDQLKLELAEACHQRSAAIGFNNSIIRERDQLKQQLAEAANTLRLIQSDFYKHGESKANHSDGEYTQDYSTRLQRVEQTLNKIKP